MATGTRPWACARSSPHRSPARHSRAHPCTVINARLFRMPQQVRRAWCLPGPTSVALLPRPSQSHQLPRRRWSTPIPSTPHGAHQSTHATWFLADARRPFTRDRSPSTRGSVGRRVRVHQGDDAFEVVEGGELDGDPALGLPEVDLDAGFEAVGETVGEV